MARFFIHPIVAMLATAGLVRHAAAESTTETATASPPASETASTTGQAPTSEHEAGSTDQKPPSGTSLEKITPVDSNATQAEPTSKQTSPSKAPEATKKENPRKRLRDVVKVDCSKGFLGLRKRPAECGKSRDPEYAFLPAIFVQKETGLGGVIYNELSFFTDSEPDTQSSRVGLSLTYTANNQFISRAPTFLNFQNNDWMVEGYADLRLYPNRYYGIGNTADWNYQVYREDVVSLDYEVRRRVTGPFYVGALWDLRGVFGFSQQETFNKSDEVIAESPLTEDNPAGSETNFNHGFGLQAVYDTRDDFNYPLRGGYHRLSSTGYSKIFGSQFEYVSVVVDARQYISLYRQHVLALQLLSESRFGTVPFSSMSEVGGPWQMRGYYRGRYRDKNMLLLQAEYRFPIYGRLTGVGFANAGEVYSKNAPFDPEVLRWTAGGGMRFRFGEHTYIRFDVGGNHETVAGIFNGGQAF